MIRVHAASVRDVAGAIGEDALLAALPASTRERLARFATQGDRARSAVAHLLFRLVAARTLNVEDDWIRVATDAHGKPYLRNARGFHFNLAHAGDWAVCATDSQPLGVDVEVVRPIDVDVAARIFSRQESRDLLRQKPVQRLRRFYELWTLKESYLKAVGTGLRIPPDSFTIRIRAGGEIALRGPRALTGYHFQRCDVDQDYPAAVCATHEAFARRVVYVESRALQEFACRVRCRRVLSIGRPTDPGC